MAKRANHVDATIERLSSSPGAVLRASRSMNRRKHDVFLRSLFDWKFFDHPSLADDKHTVGKTQDFRQVGGDNRDRGALVGEIAYEGVNLLDCSNIDAPRRLVEYDHFGRGSWR
jgi:hypothetical protein